MHTNKKRKCARGWVALLCGLAASAALAASGTVFVAPGTNTTAAIKGALEQLRAAGGGTLKLAPGDYHLFAAEAERVVLRVSNHDQPADHPVALPLMGISNLTLEGNGARLLLHGEAMVGLIKDATNVFIRNLSVDWARPPFTELVYQGPTPDGKGGVFSCDRALYPFTVENGMFHARGDGLDIPQRIGMAFRADTHEIVPGSADIWCNRATLREDGTIVYDSNFGAIGAGMRPGDVLVLRSFARPHPGFCLHRAKDVVFEDVVVHAAFGMAFLAQVSENVSIVGSQTAADKTCGVFPSAGRVGAHTVDATHFSNVKGQVCVKNAWFEGMMDDAINVHSTCLVIQGISADRRRIRCRYMHEGAYGFGVFQPGDDMRLIRAKTLENGTVLRIEAVDTPNEREVELALAGPLPDAFGTGDAVENATWQCAVEFRGNVVTHNRARGALFTTPKPVRVEDNRFLNISGSAILFAGDAMNWYESGGCEDVVIRGNYFRDCVTSYFQYCEGVVSIFPEIKDVAHQKKRYHRNILIEDNVFDTFDTTLLFASSAENVTWRDNTVRKNTHYPPSGRASFRVENSEKVDVK